MLEEIEALNTLKDLVENYEEIAATRMQRIKGSVLGSRDFLSALSEIYVDIKSSYKKELDTLSTKRKAGDQAVKPLLQKNNKTLMVYMSSKGKLYGPVTKKTFRVFSKAYKKRDENTDVLIIGSTGKEMFDALYPGEPFEYFDLEDDKITIDQIKSLVKIYLKYDKVYVYHSKFVNVVRQTAVSSSITGDEIFEVDVPSEISKEDMFIFEPDLEKIIHFFETQVVSSLFKQTYFENQLARQASRVNAMEEALIHIEEETKRLDKQKVRIKHLSQNKKQLETISGFLLWDVG